MCKVFFGAKLLLESHQAADEDAEDEEDDDGFLSTTSCKRQTLFSRPAPQRSW